MSKSIIAEGKTSTEAIEKGLKELHATKSMVDIKILEDEDKRSFYSILTPRVVKVELTLKENVKPEPEEEPEERKEKLKVKNENMEEIEKAKKDIENFLNEFITDKEITHSVEIKDFDIYINIDGENVNYLIGYRGENINSMQIILSAIANKQSSAKIKIFVDVAGYKERRTKTLEELADKIARTVIRTKKSITLEPMTAYERKIIHSRLQASDKVKTFSKGEEPYRKVIISLK
jgi:spoIIIJ-associated protein